jgi:hypothetical protein
MGIALRLIEASKRNDLDGAISAAAQANVNAVDVLGDRSLLKTPSSWPSSHSSIGCQHRVAARVRRSRWAHVVRPELPRPMATCRELR